MTKARILIIGFIFVAATVGLSLIYVGEASDNDTSNGKVFSILHGFKPGSNVSYKIISQDGISTGQEIVNEKGQVVVPGIKSDQVTESSHLIYDLDVGNNKDSVHLNFKIDSSTGKILVRGKGLEEFSDIKINSGDLSKQTKADWAGTFTELVGFGSYKTENSGSYKIAFFNNNIARDVAGTNPLIIEILDASGGGGPDSTGVNQYTNTYCGNPPISVCRTQAMQQHINDIRNNYIRAFMMMTEQFSAVMMQQVASIGMFFDAKMQLETQRELQTLQAEAHKDYHPSEQMCQFGSFVKSIARSEEKSLGDNQALNGILMSNYLNRQYTSSAEGYFVDVATRLKQFREVYCDPKDNNDGLSFVCQHDPFNDDIEQNENIGGQDFERLNKDIDYLRTAEYPLTLDINFSDNQRSSTEEDIIALAKNLYWHQPFESVLPKEAPKKSRRYMDARRIMSIQNVAHNSFTNLVGMKSESESEINENGSSFMKSLMREFGLNDAEINQLLGEYPSYYAQMEVLTKKIYQNPDFYTNLYDKPANVDRIGVSMDAIKVMQMRDYFDASLRREMLTSLLVEEILTQKAEKVSDEINAAVERSQ